MKENILVTGGAGYIGSHAVRYLKSLGHQVTVVDNLSHGHKEALPDGIAFFECDVGDVDSMKAILQDCKIDLVMHFASYIEVGESVADPAKYYANNVIQGIRLLEALKLASLKRLVFSSTAAVYGNPDSDLITEEHPLKPINPYGRTKLMMEQILADHAVAYGLGYVVLRYFNVAGADPDGGIGEAHEPESHLIPRLLAAAHDESVVAKIFGTDYGTPDGTCVRDYIHVHDLVRAHALAMAKALPNGGGQTFNLGSAKGFSVREVVDACQRVTGKTLRVEEHPRRPGDPATLVASHSKAKKDLGWSLAYPDLDTIVEHAWKWHSTHPNGYQVGSRNQSTVIPSAKDYSTCFHLKGLT